jgi:hypothetical protein
MYRQPKTRVPVRGEDDGGAWEGAVEPMRWGISRSRNGDGAKLRHRSARNRMDHGTGRLSLRKCSRAWFGPPGQLIIVFPRLSTKLMVTQLQARYKPLGARGANAAGFRASYSAFPVHRFLPASKNLDAVLLTHEHQRPSSPRSALRTFLTGPALPRFHVVILCRPAPVFACFWRELESRRSRFHI